MGRRFEILRAHQISLLRGFAEFLARSVHIFPAILLECALRHIRQGFRLHIRNDQGPASLQQFTY
jgi:hypothetical protein